MMMNKPPFPPVFDLIPHGQAMVLLDELHAWDGETAICRMLIRQEMPFVVDGSVAAEVCLEYMAQAIGCAAGMKERERGRKLQIGFILGTREFKMSPAPLSVGDQLEIGAKCIFGSEQIASFECWVDREKKRIAEATINVYGADDLEQLGEQL